MPARFESLHYSMLQYSYFKRGRKICCGRWVSSMRKHTRLLAMMSVLICVFSLGTNAAQGVRAGLLMRLSTRTGPGTQYDEPGTYYQNTWNTAQVQVINSAWDDHNDIWWVQVDFAASGKKFRAYRPEAGQCRHQFPVSGAGPGQRGDDQCRQGLLGSGQGLCGSQVQCAQSYLRHGV